MERKIRDVFEKTFETDALIARPATKAELGWCNDSLKTLGCPWIPKGYRKFLKKANGYSWNGYEFFGTYQIKENDSGYILNDIASVNRDWRERRDGIDGILVLGRRDEDLYAYNSETETYVVLDCMFFFELESHATFKAMFMDNVGIDADR